MAKNINQYVAALPARKYDTPISVREAPSIREARLANRSPRYPAPTVETHPVACREKARLPS